jgi:hypothetical protein
LPLAPLPSCRLAKKSPWAIYHYPPSRWGPARRVPRPRCCPPSAGPLRLRCAPLWPPGRAPRLPGCSSCWPALRAVLGVLPSLRVCAPAFRLSIVPSHRPPAARTIATMPARIASGRAGQAWIRACRSGEKRADFVSTAPASAPASAEMPVFPWDSGGTSPDLKTAVGESPPGVRIPSHPLRDGQAAG